MSQLVEDRTPMSAKRKQPEPALAYLDTRLFVPVTMQAHTLQALVDTGSVKSYIGLWVQHHVAHTRQLQENHVDHLRSPSGRSCPGAERRAGPETYLSQPRQSKVNSRGRDVQSASWGINVTCLQK
ncbi:hypothetical protein RN001_015226 [Aquatica leii]|uniref:Uncharacterized protein n=1 Tax=Aquatica leii TaxID=1421715 RepID=A0AAN7SBY8_9COLE|nr:hypothetical protein RN001_015226 [Aquatica leii]